MDGMLTLRFLQDNACTKNTHSYCIADQLCGLVVKVTGYRPGGPGFDSRSLQEKKVLGLERGPLSLLSTTEELLGRIVAASV
jgi:hypothetical protein